MASEDWSVARSVEQYEYKTKNIILRYWPRLHMYSSAFFGANSFKKDFMIKNGIKKNQKAILPKFFLIQHKESNYIAKVRDSIFMDKYNLYKKTQSRLSNVIKAVTDELEISEKNCITQEEVLADQEKKLRQAKSDKNDLDIITLQSSIACQEATVAAEKIRLNITKENLVKLHKTLELNKVAWKKQISIIDSMTRTYSNLFMNRITRKVKSTFHFSHFEFLVKDYSTNKKQLMDGEKY